MDRETVRKLVHLARLSAVTWQRTRSVTFRGETVLATENTRYRFVDGVFAGRLEKTSASTIWETPPALEDLELIGFLADEGGLFSLSPRFRPGAFAVLWNARVGTTSDDAYTLTSPALECTRVTPAPELPVLPDRSDVFRVPVRRPPTVRRPAPPSMTKIQPFPPAGGER